jgi:hypothetical protein
MPTARAHIAAPSFQRVLAPALVLIVTALLAGCNATKRTPVVIPPRYPTLPPKEGLPEFLQGTIFERTDVANTDPLNVNNFGLVVNLRGTGDTNVKLSVKDYIIKQMMKGGFGSSRTPGMEGLQANEVLKDPRVAIVRVDALIPPGARTGQRLDVQVSAMPNTNTSSLAGGSLYTTDLFVNGFDLEYPGRVIDVMAVAEGPGPIFVNPAYALSDAVTDPTARASLRYGTVLGRAVVKQDRAILLRIRAPEFRMAAQIGDRINQYFGTSGVAAPFDEGIVQLYTPRRFGDDWEHFVGVATHLYFNTSAEFSAAKARQLADEAVKPDAPLLDISYCWEGLGATALPSIVPLMSHESPDVAFAAARAAAHLGESSALNVLLNMARTAEHPFQVAAVQVLGRVPRSPVINGMLRTLLNAPESSVRIEAYRLLADAGDNAIYSKVIGSDNFVLDIVPSEGPSLIYASRRGTPRIAIFGNKPSLVLPISFSALNTRLTITGDSGQRTVKIFYRDPAVNRPQPIISNPDVAEIVARLGGEGAENAPQRLSFSYGEVVAIVQAMTEQKDVVAVANGVRSPTPFMIQEVPRVQDEIDTAPPIPERGRPTGADAAPQQPGPDPEKRVEARK